MSIQANLTVNPKECEEQVLHLLSRDLVPMIVGSPGISKSAVMQRVAKKLNLKVIDWRGSSADPTDTNGLPRHNEETGKAEYCPFDTFPLDTDEIPEGYDGFIILMEEFNSAPRAVQAAAYKVVLDKLVGNDKKLHPKCKIVALGNKKTDGAIVNPMSTALQSRVITLEMNSDIQESQDFITRNFDSRIAAYAYFRPENIHNFDPKHTDYSYSCMRTWEFCHKIVDGISNVEPYQKSICGTLGRASGLEFVAFCSIYEELPNIQDIVKIPETYPMPSKQDVLFALASAVSDNMNKTNAEALIKFAMRMPIEHKLLIVQLLFKRDPELALSDVTDPIVTEVREKGMI